MDAAEAPNQRRLNDSIADLPLFYGSGKDNITADGLITRVDAAIVALGWTDPIAYNYFTISLREKAEKWLKQQAKVLMPDFIASWDYIKPIFKQAFGVQLDRSKVYLAMSGLQMDKDETPFDFSLRVGDTMEMIEELNKVDATSAIPAVADRTDANLRLRDIAVHNRAIMGMYEILFTAGLTTNLQTAIIQKGVQTYAKTVETAIQIHNLKKHNGAGAVHATRDEEEDDVNAVGNGSQNPYRSNNGGQQANRQGRGRANFRGNGGQTRGSYNNSNSRGNGGNGGNTQPKPICVYCKKPGHHQDDCYTRIAENKPCLTGAGRAYWPRKEGSRSQAPVRENDDEENSQSSVRSNSVFQR
jgi:hypothetical protein